MIPEGRRRWLAALLPRSPRQRASCIAVYAPVLVYLVASMVRAFGWESGHLGTRLLVAVITLAGPLTPCWCLLGWLPAWSVPFVAFGLLLVPYFVIARHDVGTMPWSWFLVLSTLWTGCCWWMTSAWLARTQ